MSAVDAQVRSKSEVNIYQIEFDFCRLNTKFGESDFPVYERWGYILQFIPEARTRRISGDYTDVYQRLYETGTGVALFAAVELAFLQIHFFDKLLAHGVGRANANRYMVEGLAIWRSKLIDRFNHTKTWHVSTKVGENGEEVDILHAPILPPVTSHNWLH